MTAKELREKRAKLIADARTLNDERANADGVLSAEDQNTFDKMLADASEYKAQAERLERLERESAVDPGEPVPGPELANAETPTIDVRTWQGYTPAPVGLRGQHGYRDAFNRYLRGGANALSGEQYAALQSDDSEQAGYLVASEQFASELLKDVDDLLFVRQHARIHTVREANTLGIRKRTAKMSTFGWSSELAVSAEDTALKYGKKVLTPHACTGLIKVSRDLVRRAVISADQIVREEMAIDAGETLEDGYFTGTGSQQPLGVFTASADGISTSRDVSTGNTTTAIKADGLQEAKYSLKSQYRNGARWLFHRDGVKQIAKLKDGEGQYLWRPGLVEGQPDRLLNLPLDESERSPNTFTTGLYVGLLANWRYYEIADALDMEVQVLDQLYAATNQIGYIGRIKTDGMPTLEEAFARVTLA